MKTFISKQDVDFSRLNSKKPLLYKFLPKKVTGFLETPIDSISLARKGYHIVVPAFIGLTYFSTYCQDVFNIKQTEQEKFIIPVNQNMETGTLYPKCNLTIIPLRYSSNADKLTRESIDYTNGKGFTHHQIKEFIEDAINCRKRLYKSK